jgi:hypothetical protein
MFSLFLTFLTLKMAELVTWSWWFVFTPFMIWAVIVLIVSLAEDK